MGATAVLSASALAVEPGKETTLEVRVKNTGGVVDQFTIEVVGDASPWSTVEPPQLSLFPGAEGVAQVRFHPPRSANTVSAQVPFGVRVASREDPPGSTVEEGTIDVGAFVEPAAELVPRTSHGRRKATHEVAFDNRGNARVDVELTAVNADNLLAFSFKPPALNAAPGSATFAKMQVRAKQRFFTGAPKTRPFQVVAQPSGGGAAITMEGGMLQEALIPTWLLPVLIALIVIIIALVLLWFLLVKPAVVSTAKDAVSAPLAKQANAISALQQKAASGGGGGGGGGGGAAPPSPVPGAILTTTNVDGRLGNGAPPSSNPVAANSTLQVTDLVFGNSGSPADTGILKVQRDNGSGGITDLLVLRLDNFRDLDYHFVTPVVFQKGEKIVMNCNPACPSTSVYYLGLLQSQK